MERTRRTDTPFGDGVDLDQLARAHRRVRKLERARDRAVLLHAENITEAQRAEAAGNRRIEQSLRSYGLTRDRYDGIMDLVRSDPVLHGILQEAVRGLSENGSAEGAPVAGPDRAAISRLADRPARASGTASGG